MAIATGLLVAACSTAPAPASSSVPTANPATGEPSATTSATRTPSTPAPAPTQPAVPLLGALPTDELDAATAERLQATLDEIVAGGAPDVIAAVITADGTWAGAAGTVGPKGGPAKPNSVFSVASVTKTAVATLLLRLVELGKVDLDAPIATYLPDMAEASNGATVRQVLAMRGGIGETAAAVVNEALADCTRAWTKEDILAAFPAAVADPGKLWVYSNPGYKLAGYVAEQVSGLSLGEALRQYVVEPAGVERFILQGPDSPAPKPWALPIDGHRGPLDADDYGVGGTLPCLSDATLSVGGTGMAADAPSLAQWGWQLFAGEMIDRASLAALTATAPDDYGLGVWRFYDFSPDIAFGHAGNKPGFATLLAVLPERQVVVALCINDQNADPYGPVRQVLNALKG